jgi:hypothetical protein
MMIQSGSEDDYDSDWTVASYFLLGLVVVWLFLDFYNAVFLMLMLDDVATACATLYFYNVALIWVHLWSVVIVGNWVCFMFQGASIYRLLENKCILAEAWIVATSYVLMSLWGGVLYGLQTGECIAQYATDAPDMWSGFVLGYSTVIIAIAAAATMYIIGHKHIDKKPLCSTSNPASDNPASYNPASYNSV